MPIHGHNGADLGSGNPYESQRVWGELHMDDFDVSHTKDGFR
jgi:hypothetical protein